MKRKEKRVTMKLRVDENYIKNHIVMKLMNYENNKEKLENMPHQVLGDLAVSYGIEINDPDILEPGMSAGIININNEFNIALGMSVDVLNRYALINMPKLHPAELAVLYDATHHDLYDSDSELPEVEKFEPFELYCLTNKDNVYGASTILYPGQLEKMAKLAKNNFYVIPSSTHEMLIVNKHELLSVKEINNIINLVNADELSEDEILSSHVYEYDVDSKQLINPVDKSVVYDVEKGFSEEAEEENEMSTLVNNMYTQPVEAEPEIEM